MAIGSSENPLRLSKVDLASRIRAKDLSIQDQKYAFGEGGKGLDVLTRAFHASDMELCQSKTLDTAIQKYSGGIVDTSDFETADRNKCLSALIRYVWSVFGWMEAYCCLAEAAPEMGMTPRLMADVKTGMYWYPQLRVARRKRPVIDVRMTIVASPENDSLDRLGPKTAGGQAWRESQEFAEVLQRPRWNDPGYTKGVSPCISLGWLGIQVGAVLPEHVGIATTLLAMNWVDYDLDFGEHNAQGFQNGLDTASKHACMPGTEMQSVAIAAMISYDVQVRARSIQQTWADKNQGSFIPGPEQVPPRDWVSLLVADCAAISPFQHNPKPKDYDASRLGMFAAMIMFGLYDVIYDQGCSNRLTSPQYAEAAGVAQYGIHAVMAIGLYEKIGEYMLDRFESKPEERMIFGYASDMITGTFDTFNTRYRSWERIVKYMRQLQQSKAIEAKALLELIHGDYVLRDCTLEEDADDVWARAMQSGLQDLRKRYTVKYFIPSKTTELFSTPGVPIPELCKNCKVRFDAVMRSPELEEVRAIPGLPEIVTLDRAAGLAAGIRRACLWALTDDCCIQCACRIGSWADKVSYSVLSARTYDEATTGADLWQLQNYFIGTITYWPICIPVLISCFDLLVDLTIEPGAMGHRDVVDI
ncbi:hypothetical protein BO86DRAFT_240816 [Aspergillus japonicus CBS 114.51]|uniref:Uncharacterized protein n=1 Tax=Aspergillus japonicus CBS 114.51 TaxID=1448312 RepID=A0A8T8X912_ASPJA|nr:hypothetical protein BO86DRAFT_240816 [Aspergillus japonicus CBS 114.51]RAH84374.1 hypothetical protein BO86DRAFT_240816 [Aspergillus japonicus CBS 114.51]